MLQQQALWPHLNHHISTTCWTCLLSRGSQVRVLPSANQLARELVRDRPSREARRWLLNYYYRAVTGLVDSTARPTDETLRVKATGFWDSSATGNAGEGARLPLTCFREALAWAVACFVAHLLPANPKDCTCYNPELDVWSNSGQDKLVVSADPDADKVGQPDIDARSRLKREH